MRASHAATLFWGIVCLALAFMTGHLAATLIEAINKIGSIFFGGGTPSLMEVETVAWIIDRAQRAWRFANDVEITLEANPTSVEADRFGGAGAEALFSSLNLEARVGAFELDEVRGEIKASLQQGGPDAIGIDRYALVLEGFDLLDVETTGNHDFHVLETLRVERSPHLLDQAWLHPAQLVGVRFVLKRLVSQFLRSVQAHAP